MIDFSKYLIQIDQEIIDFRRILNSNKIKFLLTPLIRIGILIGFNLILFFILYLFFDFSISLILFGIYMISFGILITLYLDDFAYQFIIPFIQRKFNIPSSYYEVIAHLQMLFMYKSNVFKLQEFFYNNATTIKNRASSERDQILIVIDKYLTDDFRKDYFNVQFNKIFKSIEKIVLNQINKTEAEQLLTKPKAEVKQPDLVSSSPDSTSIDKKKNDGYEISFSESIVHNVNNAEELFNMAVDLKMAKPFQNMTGSGMKTKDQYIKEYLNNVEVGLLGELFVLHYEKSQLEKANAKHLVKYVRHISLELGDGYGYDIGSYEPNGNQKYIEVKTTVENQNFGFYLTENEYKYLTNEAGYVIYRVYDFEKEKLQGCIYKIDKAAFNDYFSYNPTEYKVSVL